MIQHFIRVIVGIVGGALLFAVLVAVIIGFKENAELFGLVVVLGAMAVIAGQCFCLAVGLYDRWRQWRAERSQRSPDVRDTTRWWETER